MMRNGYISDIDLNQHDGGEQKTVDNDAWSESDDLILESIVEAVMRDEELQEILIAEHK